MIQETTVRVSSGRNIWLLVLPCLNLLLLTFLVFHYAVDAPTWDQWNFIPFLEKSYQNNLTLHDFWMQHNEHRLVFPRLIMLVCARLSGWNVRWELAVNLLLALGIYSIYIRQIHKTTRLIGDASLVNIIPAAGLMTFSLRQWSNWTWGWQLQIFLNVLAVAAGVVLLSQPSEGWRRLAAAIGCGFVATYSFANGMLFWVVGAFILVCLPPAPRKNLRLAIWSGAALLFTASYLYHFHAAEGGLSFALRHPLSALIYAVVYMGSFPVLKMSVGFAFILGVLGVSAFCWANYGLLRDAQIPRLALIPYQALALYVALSALASSEGRAMFGADQALESRYTTISYLFWFATLALLLLRLRHASSRSLLLLVVSGLWLAFGSAKDVHHFKDFYVTHAPDQERLQHGDANIPILVENLKAAPEGIRVLQTHHLTVFRR